MSSIQKAPTTVKYQHVEARSVMSTRERRIALTLRLVVITIAILFALFPVVFVAATAFNPVGAISTRNLIPNVSSVGEIFTNFNKLLFDPANQALWPFWRWIGNSFVVATTTTFLSVMTTALAAYSFSRFRFSGRRQLMLGVLLVQVFPNLLAMIALFLLMQQIGRLPEIIPKALPFLAFIDWSFLAFFGLNSLGGLILVYLGGAMGINTWLMKGFFDSVPREIDESAMVDGATHWQTYRLLIFPLVRPILAVVAVLSFVGTFNEFVLARILLTDNQNWTIMVGLFQFINGRFEREWGMFAAGALIAATPVVIVYLLLQDQIVGGLTQGAVKG